MYYNDGDLNSCSIPCSSASHSSFYSESPLVIFPHWQDGGLEARLYKGTSDIILTIKSFLEIHG